MLSNQSVLAWSYPGLCTTPVPPVYCTSENEIISSNWPEISYAFHQNGCFFFKPASQKMTGDSPNLCKGLVLSGICF